MYNAIGCCALASLVSSAPEMSRLHDSPTSVCQSVSLSVLGVPTPSLNSLSEVVTHRDSVIRSGR